MLGREFQLIQYCDIWVIKMFTISHNIFDSKHIPNIALFIFIFLINQRTWYTVRHIFSSHCAILSVQMCPHKIGVIWLNRNVCVLCLFHNHSKRHHAWVCVCTHIHSTAGVDFVSGAGVGNGFPAVTSG